MIAGRYSLDREIGRGGSGVVWLGRDEVLGRQVALKRIGVLPGTDGTDLARAEREAQLGARLNHAHVVSVFDVVTDGDSDARWLVMEYVDGITLGQLVSGQGALSPDDAAPLLLQAADALGAAHAAGIAHRDVKPSNILLDRQYRVKLTDFGIARIAADPALTQTGMVTGSPAYLAPEVATGSRGDEASDVWSLGATAFHLLAGRPPYEVGDNVLGALYRIVHEEPPTLPEAGWMAPLLAGTMVRDPAARWTMAQVRDFLADPRHRVPAAAAPEVDHEGTRLMAAPAPEPAAPVVPPSAAARTTAYSSGPRRPSRGLLWAGLGLLAVLLLGVLGWSLLRDDPAGTAAPSTPSSSPSSRTPSPSKSPSVSPARPTSAGMEAFIRDYVTTVADDPDRAWEMLTPKFQRESGGIEKYRDFWGAATNGRVLSIETNPDNLSVSYQVRFDDFRNGPGPTVLDLTFADGTYKINGERSAGFVPAG